MPTLTVTLADVGVGSSTCKVKATPVQVGEAVDQGQPLYLDTTDSKYYRCIANGTVTQAETEYIAMTAASADGYVIVAEPGTSPGESLVNLGATLVVGTCYAVDTTAGGIIEVQNVASGAYVTTLGIAVSAALLDFQIQASRETKP